MYGVENVVGDTRWAGKAYWPGVLARTHGEHQRMLQLLKGSGIEIEKAVEFGCGYARMTPVLTSLCDDVQAFERDPELAEIASEVAQGFRVTQVPSLESVPYPRGEADLVLTYTVLQHMPDDECFRVLAEIKRCLVTNGILIAAEESDGKPSGNVWPRTPQRYAEMGGFHLLRHEPRFVEDNRKSGTIGVYAKL